MWHLMCFTDFFVHPQEQILALGAKKLLLASSVEGEDDDGDGDAKEAELRAELMKELYSGKKTETTS